jgi:hypothetical protein
MIFVELYSCNEHDKHKHDLLAKSYSYASKEILELCLAFCFSISFYLIYHEHEINKCTRDMIKLDGRYSTHMTKTNEEIKFHTSVILFLVLFLVFRSLLVYFSQIILYKPRCYSSSRKLMIRIVSICRFC